MSKIAERYRRRADAFEALIEQIAPEQWSRPSPCEGWSVHDVVRHVVDYAALVLHDRAGVAGPPTLADHAGPLPAFRASRAAVERVLDDPATPGDVARYIDGAVSVDLPQHGWDVAVATGQDPTMDAREVEWLWKTLSEHPGLWQWQRDNGWYGPPLPVAENATPQDQVLALLGRDPTWRPPHDGTGVTAGDGPA